MQLNSVVSMKCFPDFTTYCASRAAAYSITQALRAQLARAVDEPLATRIRETACRVAVSTLTGDDSLAVESSERGKP